MGVGAEFFFPFDFSCFIYDMMENNPVNPVEKINLE
jgi:hypothetical protein